MKKRMLYLLLGITMFASGAMPVLAAPAVHLQQFRFQSEVKTSDTKLTGFMVQTEVLKTDVMLTTKNITVPTVNLLENISPVTESFTQEEFVTLEEMAPVSLNVDAGILEAQTLAQSITSVIAESQEEVQRLIEEERKAEEERKRKEEEERKRKEEEERRRKEEERKRKEEEERKRRQQASSKSGSAIASYAKRFVGNPYVYGGNSLTGGIDCSHFVYQVLKNCGVYNGGYVTSAGWRSKGKAVSSLSQAQAGDIICYDGHVAIYDGNGMLIEALGKKHGICYKRSATSDKILAIRRFV